jgi:hypothetical protein
VISEKMEAKDKSAELVDMGHSLGVILLGSKGSRAMRNEVNHLRYYTEKCHLEALAGPLNSFK